MTWFSLLNSALENFFVTARHSLTSPVAREWLSTMAPLASPSPSIEQPLSPMYELGSVDSPLLHREHPDFLEFGEDDKEDFKEYEINWGANVYSCSLHTGLNFIMKNCTLMYLNTDAVCLWWV